ncbi:MAG: class IV adenylate cyclase [Pirellulales bacterium]|nr:class IV adenylate cyclase [Pirellulales bacterium]
MRNIEIKARLADIRAAEKTAEEIATKNLGTQHQIDTYFDARHGRLKLRQIDGLSAQLIWYSRPDSEEPAASDYELVPVPNPETLKTALTAAMGTRIVVEKYRRILLWNNVRIHLDRVTSLGEFLEFEAVIGPSDDETAAYEQVEELMRRFDIEPADLLPNSYADMLI